MNSICCKINPVQVARVPLQPGNRENQKSQAQRVEGIDQKQIRVNMNLRGRQPLENYIIHIKSRQGQYLFMGSVSYDFFENILQWPRKGRVWYTFLR